MPPLDEPVPTLRLERTYACDEKALWAAWTEPAQFAKWFNAAPGKDAVVHEMDVTPGGTMRFDMFGPDGTVYPNEGIYTKVEPPRGLSTQEVVDGEQVDMHVQIRAVSGGTKLVVTQVGLPADVHDMAREGWALILERLATVVES